MIIIVVALVEVAAVVLVVVVLVAVIVVIVVVYVYVYVRRAHITSPQKQQQRITLHECENQHWWLLLARIGRCIRLCSKLI